MPPTKMPKLSDAGAIIAKVSKMSDELEQLRNFSTEDALQLQRNTVKQQVAALNDFKQKLEDFCSRVECELNDLFSGLVWSREP